jgi:hypothetical protein
MGSASSTTSSSGTDIGLIDSYCSLTTLTSDPGVGSPYSADTFDCLLSCVPGLCDILEGGYGDIGVLDFCDFDSLIFDVKLI